ncbi:hypothetical protein IKQ02_01840 [bacterium]|nr:hypothetical protein [bacterium]
MKKIIRITAILAVLCLSLFLVVSNNMREVKADETISDLSYSRSENLLDLANLDYDTSEESYSTIKKIYLPKDNTPLVIIICYGDTDARGPKLSVNFYDIDFELVGSYNTSTENNVSSQGMTYQLYQISASNIPSNAFSFSIEEISFDYGAFDLDDETNGAWIMAYRGSNTEYELIDFEEYTGLIDIQNNSYVFEVSYANPLTEANIKSCIDAEDDYAGNLKDSLVINASEYLSSSSTIGVYPVSVSVSDGHNTTLCTIYIHVVDKIKPVITGPDSIRIPVFTHVNKDILTESFTATDVYDGDLTDSIDVVSSFSSNPGSIFSESITLKVLDHSKNYDTKTVLVEYYDSIPPVITGPSTIMIGYKAKQTLAQIVASNLSITDDLEPHPIISYPTDEYTGHESKVGTYSVVVQATDSSEVPVTHSLSITISDTIKPVIFINSYVIETISSVTLSKEDIDDLLYASNVLSNGRIYTSTVLNDTYTGHENEKGHYIYQVKYVDQETQEEIIKAFQINVNNDTYVVSKVDDAVKSYSLLEIGVLASMTFIFVGATILLVKKGRKLKSLIQ